MKIKYIKRDLFSTPYSCIMHSCNSKGVMGSGVAKIIREKHPLAYHAYMKAHKENMLQLGTINFARSKDKFIFNAITQDSFGGNKIHADYNAIRKVMYSMNMFLNEINQKHLALPKIGAGLANGDWTIIENIIEEEMTNVQPVVYYLED